MNHNRREFIKGLATASSAIPFSSAFGTSITEVPKKRFPISFFTKAIDGYDLEFMTETLGLSGLDGLDLVVRPQGRVEPERIEDDLPKVVETAKRSGLVTEMMVTAICDRDKMSEQVLATAAKVGVKYYRLGWYDYNYSIGIWNSLQDIKKRIAKLAQLNRELGIQGGYQNHSGNKVGAPVWDIWELLQVTYPELIGSQFDIRHAVCEGSSAWVLGLQLLSQHINSLAIKDFTWEMTGKKAEIVSVPLGEGLVDFNLYFKMLKELNIIAPITLHIEYPLLRKEEEGFSLLQKQKIIVSKIKKDVSFIRSKLTEFQLV